MTSARNDRAIEVDEKGHCDFCGKKEQSVARRERPGTLGASRICLKCTEAAAIELLAPPPAPGTAGEVISVDLAERRERVLAAVLLRLIFADGHANAPSAVEAAQLTLVAALRAALVLNGAARAEAARRAMAEPAPWPRSSEHMSDRALIRATGALMEAGAPYERWIVLVEEGEAGLMASVSTREDFVRELKSALVREPDPALVVELLRVLERIRDHASLIPTFVCSEGARRELFFLAPELNGEAHADGGSGGGE